MFVLSQAHVINPSFTFNSSYLSLKSSCECTFHYYSSVYFMMSNFYKLIYLMQRETFLSDVPFRLKMSCCSAETIW